MNAQVLVVKQEIPHRVGHTANADLQGGAVRNPLGNQPGRLIIRLVKDLFFGRGVEGSLLFKNGGHLTDVELVALSQDPGQPRIDLDNDPLRYLRAHLVAQGVKPHVEVSLFVHRRALNKHKRRLDPLLHHAVRIAVMRQDNALGVSVRLRLAHGGTQKRTIVVDPSLRLAAEEGIVLVQHEHGVQFHALQAAAALTKAG